MPGRVVGPLFWSISQKRGFDQKMWIWTYKVKRSPLENIYLTLDSFSALPQSPLSPVEARGCRLPHYAEGRFRTEKLQLCRFRRVCGYEIRHIISRSERGLSNIALTNTAPNIGSKLGWVRSMRCSQSIGPGSGGSRQWLSSNPTNNCGKEMQRSSQGENCIVISNSLREKVD